MSTEEWSEARWLESERSYVRKRRLQRQLMVKRILDLTLAGLGLIFLAPVMVVIAAAIGLSSGWPILFRQPRLGKLGRPFQVCKFRTMVVGAVHQGAGLATFRGDPRVTRVGKVLREYHLDELPQLWNVIQGTMSLVGPRPVLVSALQTYDDFEKRRLLLRPGITGWQQVKGGALNDLDERIRLDVWYVDHWTWWMDLRILVRTLAIVLRKEGVYGKDGWQRGRAVNEIEIK